MARSLAKEPLVHFVAAGLCLFGLYGVLNDGVVGESDRQIVVDRGDVDRLRGTFAGQWRRQPTREELQALIDEHVREEVLYREALAMELDAYDTIVRRRLIQKLEFFAEDVAVPTEPTDDEIAAFFQTHASRYRSGARVSFAHIYFSADQRQDPGGDARRELAALSREPAVSRRVAVRGDPFMLPFDHASRSRRDVERTFGPAFAEALFELQTVDTWEGPIPSSYGYHLVRITGREDSVRPELSSVKDQVRQDLQGERRAQASEAFYQSLLARYDVSIDEGAVGDEPSSSLTAREMP